MRLAGDTLVLSHDPAPAASTPVRLDDLVRLASGRIALDLELKEAGYEERVLHAVDPRPAGLILTSFLPAAVARLRELDPAITTGLLIGPHDHGRDLRGRAAACGAQLLCPHVSQVTDALRSTAARSGPLVVWTVNETRVLAGMLRDAGGRLRDHRRSRCRARHPRRRPIRAAPRAGVAAPVAGAPMPRRARTRAMDRAAADDPMGCTRRWRARAARPAAAAGWRAPAGRWRSHPSACRPRRAAPSARPAVCPPTPDCAAPADPWRGRTAARDRRRSGCT